MTHAAAHLAKRGAHRVSWALYNARVSGRRAVLDVSFSSRRRHRLLEASKDVVAGGDAIHRVSAPVGIEPRYGYLVRGRAAVIEDALMGSECVRLTGERYAFSGVPTLRRLAADRRYGRVLPGPVISVRHVFAANYYHAVVDCIGALALLDQRPDHAALPIVIGADLRETKVMQAVIAAGLVAPERLIVQGDAWLGSTVSISFVVQDPLSEHSLRRTNAFLGRAVPAGHEPEPAGDRVYVARGASAVGRHLRNESELVAELVRRDFVCVDPGGLSWHEQYRRFRAATHVVGVHGAALTNILFRAPERMSVLELTPPGHRADVFKRVALALGYGFRRLEGTDRSRGGTRPSFVIDVDRVLSIVDGWDRVAIASRPAPT